MSLTIDQLRNFAGTGGISIDAGSNAKPAEIKNTGFLHAIKTFFGFKSAKAQNEATINAIRSAILSDPKLFLAHERSNELLGAVKGTITAEKVRTIISDLTRTVDGMMGFQKKEAVTAYIRGRVAAAGIPKFAKGLGKEVGPQFMAYYAKTIAYAAMKDGEPEAGWGSVDFSAKIKEFKKEGWKIYGTPRSLEVALLEYYDELKKEDISEVMGEATSFISKSVGSQTALNSAATKYAQLASAVLRGRVVRDMFSDSDDVPAEFDKFYAAYETKVEKEIKGELIPSFTVIRSKGKNDKGQEIFEMQTYCLVNESAASKARMRALENAMKESEMAQQYARKVSDFVQEAFKDGESY